LIKFCLSTYVTYGIKSWHKISEENEKSKKDEKIIKNELSKKKKKHATINKNMRWC